MDSGDKSLRQAAARKIKRDLGAEALPESALRCEKTTQALAYWHGLRATRNMPAPVDFSPEHVHKLLANLQWISVLHAETDYRLDVVGEVPRQLHGVPVRGRRIKEITEWPAERSKALCILYDQVVRTRQPVCTGGNLSYADRQWSQFEAVSLPFSVDGTRVDRILVVAEYNIEAPPGEEAAPITRTLPNP